MTRLERPRILIRGTGEIASAAAHLLHQTGAAVALQTSRPPVAIRRTMAFSDAVFDGVASLEGLTSSRIRSGGELNGLWAAGDIPLLYCDFAEAVAACQWGVLVDARMNKQVVPENQIGLAPLVIGMGPGCTVGSNVDMAIETSWEALGQIIRHGATLPLRGEPRAVLGHARDRFRYAPKAGIIRAEAEIGQVVGPGEIIAWVDDVPVVAVFEGVVRGLTHDGVPVEAGNKIAEIDPRIGSVRLAGIDERPRRIAEAVAVIVGERFPALRSAIQAV